MVLLLKPAIVFVSGLARYLTRPPGISVVLFGLLSHVDNVSGRFVPQPGSVAEFFLCSGSQLKMEDFLVSDKLVRIVFSRV